MLGAECVSNYCSSVSRKFPRVKTAVLGITSDIPDSPSHDRAVKMPDFGSCHPLCSAIRAITAITKAAFCMSVFLDIKKARQKFFRRALRYFFLDVFEQAQAPSPFSDFDSILGEPFFRSSRSFLKSGAFVSSPHAFLSSSSHFSISSPRFFKASRRALE